MTPRVDVALSLLVALGAALAFYPARRLGSRRRTLAWLAASVVVALSPCLIPPASNPLRFIATLVAIAFLTKLYDVHHASRHFQEMSLRSYLAYLPNGFWV